MNKKEAQQQLKVVKKEVKRLEEIVNAPINLFEIITCYTDVCKELGEKEYTEEDFKFLPDYYRKKALAQLQIHQIEKLFNQGFVFDWTNINQYKYYPYFDICSGSLVFSSSVYCHYYYCSGLAFYKDKKTSNFVGKLFAPIYQNAVI